MQNVTMKKEAMRDDLSWFDRRDADLSELKKIILNAKLLDSFKYYVRFR